MIDTAAPVVTKTEVDAYSLRDALTACLLSVGKDVTRPVLTQVCVEKRGGSIVLTSTDSYRLTEATVQATDASADDWSILLSTDDAKRVQSSLPKRNGRSLPLDVTIALDGDSWHTFSTRETQVRVSCDAPGARSAHSNFPKCEKLFPTETGEVASIRFDPASMIDLCKMPGRNKREAVHLEFVSELKAFVSKWEGDGVAYRHLIMPVRPGR